MSHPGPPRQSLELNDYEIKVVKLRGEFVSHDHQETDELFLVISGQLTIQMHDENVALGPGQLFVVPRGVQHCPITAGEVHAVLIEPRGVVNTGEAGGSLTTVAATSRRPARCQFHSAAAHLRSELGHACQSRFLGQGFGVRALAGILANPQSLG